MALKYTAPEGLPGRSQTLLLELMTAPLIRAYKAVLSFYPGPRSPESHSWLHLPVYSQPLCPFGAHRGVLSLIQVNMAGEDPSRQESGSPL